MSGDQPGWQSEILPRLRAISPHAAWLYSEEGRLPHYREVARRLLAQFEDPALARAGFLHGIGAGVLEQELGEVGADVLAILRGRDRLASMDVATPEDQRKLEGNVLGSVTDARGALLLVTEQLHHVDPDGLLEDWVRRFHLHPSHPPLMDGLPRFTTPTRHEPQERYPAFLRSVVSPVARRFGMWHEKNVLEDAALLLESPDRFAALVSFAAAQSAGRSAFAARVAAVRDRLRGEGIRAVRWEWRHLASMHRLLPRNSAEPARAPEWVANLHHCGYVTVVCADEAYCYTALGRLHTLEHRDHVRDTMGMGLRSGYRALHTEVQVPATAVDPPLPVAVRIIPADADEPRFRPAQGAKMCVAITRSHPEFAADRMQVFAPDGRAVVLPAGSTVLNYAYKIRNSYPAFVREAQVNRQRVDLLHPLQPGDVVFLHLGNEARPLPEGWQARVPRETVRHIRESWRHAFREELIDGGRRWLGQFLAVQRVGDPPEDAELDRLVDRVEERLHRRGHIAHLKQREWWYARLGEHAAELRGELPTGTSDPHLVLRREFLDKAIKELIFARKMAEMRARASSITTTVCRLCRPQMNDGLLVFAIQGSTLMLHRDGWSCAPPDAEPVERHFPHPRYVTVVGTDRAGLAAEVLDLFEQRGLSIAQIDGIRVGQGTGMLRLQLDPISPALLDDVLGALRSIPSLEVYGPGDAAPAQESLHLPPRRTTPLTTVQVEPHVPGPAVTDDNRFYGMEAMLSGLTEELERISDPSAPHGGHVFVHGPKRIGKTSTVLCFLRMLDRRRQVIPVYREADREQGWQGFQAEMARDLLKAARARAGAATQLPDDLALRPLGDLVAEIRRRLAMPIVLAIDESTFLMDASRSTADRRGIRDFAARVRSLPGVLAIWIGPSAARRAVAELTGLVQGARPQEVPDLTRGEVASLLAAEKFGRGYSIRVDERVVERTCILTRGNPFWVTWLASEMWKAREKDHDDAVLFHEALLERAVRHVIHDVTPFIDRYAPETRDSRQHRLAAGAILLYLARGSRRSAQWEVSPARLRDAIARQLNARPDNALFFAVMDDLRHRGSIDPTEGGGWRLKAPLLAEHLLATSGGKAKWIISL